MSVKVSAASAKRLDNLKGAAFLTKDGEAAERQIQMIGWHRER